MNRIEAFRDIEDMRSVAADLSSLLSSEQNSDIAKAFPGTVERYTGSIDDVHFALRATAEQCENGIREQFIVYAGEMAVGLSAIQIVEEPPRGVDCNVPNLSGLICNPWRKQGLGTLSLDHRLHIVNERFNGRAYSLVRRDNVASQRLVEKAGLTVVDSNETHFTYAYGEESARQ